jgi:hypothetical protein
MARFTQEEYDALPPEERRRLIAYTPTDGPTQYVEPRQAADDLTGRKPIGTAILDGTNVPSAEGMHTVGGDMVTTAGGREAVRNVSRMALARQAIPAVTPLEKYSRAIQVEYEQGKRPYDAAVREAYRVAPPTGAMLDTQLTRVMAPEGTAQVMPGPAPRPSPDGSMQGVRNDLAEAGSLPVDFVARQTANAAARTQAQATGQPVGTVAGLGEAQAAIVPTGSARRMNPQMGGALSTKTQYERFIEWKNVTERGYRAGRIKPLDVIMSFNIDDFMDPDLAVTPQGIRARKMIDNVRGAVLSRRIGAIQGVRAIGEIAGQMARRAPDMNAAPIDLAAQVEAAATAAGLPPEEAKKYGAYTKSLGYNPAFQKTESERLQRGFPGWKPPKPEQPDKVTYALSRDLKTANDELAQATDAANRVKAYDAEATAWKQGRPANMDLSPQDWQTLQAKHFGVPLTPAAEANLRSQAVNIPYLTSKRDALEKQSNAAQPPASPTSQPAPVATTAPAPVAASQPAPVNIDQQIAGIEGNLKAGMDWDRDVAPAVEANAAFLEALALPENTALRQRFRDLRTRYRKAGNGQ